MSMRININTKDTSIKIVIQIQKNKKSLNPKLIPRPSNAHILK